jgi:hypothetical protein
MPLMRIRSVALPTDLRSFSTYESRLAEWGNRKGLTKPRRNDGLPSWRVSVDSLDKWLAAYRAFGKSGLIDRNDGSARRGKTVIPAAVRKTSSVRT